MQYYSNIPYNIIDMELFKGEKCVEHTFLP